MDPLAEAKTRPLMGVTEVAKANRAAAVLQLRGVSARPALSFFHRHAQQHMAGRMSTGHMVGRMCADPVGSERVRRHPHHRA